MLCKLCEKSFYQNEGAVLGELERKSAIRGRRNVRGDRRPDEQKPSAARDR